IVLPDSCCPRQTFVAEIRLRLCPRRGTRVAGRSDVLPSPPKPQVGNISAKNRKKVMRSASRTPILLPTARMVRAGVQWSPHNEKSTSGHFGGISSDHQWL